MNSETEPAGELKLSSVQSEPAEAPGVRQPSVTHSMPTLFKAKSAFALLGRHCIAQLIPDSPSECATSDPLARFQATVKRGLSFHEQVPGLFSATPLAMSAAATASDSADAQECRATDALDELGLEAAIEALLLTESEGEDAHDDLSR